MTLTNFFMFYSWRKRSELISDFHFHNAFKTEKLETKGFLLILKFFNRKSCEYLGYLWI